MPPQPTVDELRAAVVRRAAAVSYNVVVTELRMTRANLSKFLHGSNPHSRTLTRMRDWYERYHNEDGPPAPVADAFDRMSSPQALAIRSALEEHIVKTSRRAVARAVGMSPDGLQKFLEGAAPSSITVEKLLRWHARVQAEQESLACSVSPAAGPAREE